MRADFLVIPRWLISSILETSIIYAYAKLHPRGINVLHRVSGNARERNDVRFRRKRKNSNEITLPQSEASRIFNAFSRTTNSNNPSASPSPASRPRIHFFTPLSIPWNCLTAFSSLLHRQAPKPSSSPGLTSNYSTLHVKSTPNDSIALNVFPEPKKEAADLSVATSEALTGAFLKRVKNYPETERIIATERAFVGETRGIKKESRGCRGSG